MESTSQMLKNNDNSNVPKILPLTTFITIDLGGNIFPDRLFSIFCAETRVFLFERDLRWFQTGPARPITMPDP
jgi:hypothetical protein